MNRISIIPAILLFLSSQLASAQVFVDKSNTSGFEDGETWATAFSALQLGIQEAFGTGESEVRVAAGIYDEERLEQGARSLLLAPGVRLLGGFPPGGGDPNTRDPEQNVTVIEGSPVSEQVIISSFVNGAEVDGFTIRPAQELVGQTPFTGRGVLFVQGSTAVFRDCIFVGFGADTGAALFCTEESSPSFIDCVFLENTSTLEADCPDPISEPLIVGGGGSVLAADDEDSIPNFVNCVFTRNVGTAIIASSDMYIVNSHFVGNIDLPDCRSLAGNSPASASAINITGGSPVVWGSFFSGNLSLDAVPTLETQTKGVGAGPALISDFGSTIRNSTGSTDSQPEITACTFHRNVAQTGFGAFSDTQDSITFFVNSILWNNPPLDVPPFGVFVNPDDNKSALQLKQDDPIPGVRYFNSVIFRGRFGFQNITTEPRLVRDIPITGTVTSVNSNRGTKTITLTTPGASLPPNVHAGKVLFVQTNEDAGDVGASFYILDNNAVTITVFDAGSRLPEPNLINPNLNVLPDLLDLGEFNATIRDFHVRGDSPGLNRAQQVFQTADAPSFVDLDGNLRVFTTPDIGVDEYVSSVSDSDGDGIPDNNDPDNDNDGIPNGQDIALNPNNQLVNVQFDAAPVISPSIPPIQTPGNLIVVDLTEFENDIEDDELLLNLLVDELSMFREELVLAFAAEIEEFRQENPELSEGLTDFEIVEMLADDGVIDLSEILDSVTPLKWTAGPDPQNVITSTIFPFTDRWFIQPAPNVTGSTFVRLTLRDSRGQTAFQDVNVTVTNAAPTLANTPNISFLEDTTSDPINIRNLIVDLNDDTSTIDISVTDSANIFHDANLLANSGVLQLIATANFNGTETIVVHLADDNGGFTDTNIQVTVVPVNDPPFISPPVTDPLILIGNELVVDLGQFENDVDDNDANLRWSVSGVNTSLITAQLDAVTDRLTLRRVGNAEGSDQITLLLSDASNASVSQVVTVQVPLTFQLNTFITPRDGGSVTRNPEGTRYLGGTVVTLTAVPANGFVFDRWAGDLGGTQRQTTIEMSASRSVFAIFEATDPVEPPFEPIEGAGEGEGAAEGMGEGGGEGEGEGAAEGEGEGDGEAKQPPGCSTGTRSSSSGFGDLAAALLVGGVLMSNRRRTSRPPTR